jgi:hypothetical protein
VESIFIAQAKEDVTAYLEFSRSVCLAAIKAGKVVVHLDKDCTESIKILVRTGQLTDEEHDRTHVFFMQLPSQNGIMDDRHLANRAHSLNVMSQGSIQDGHTRPPSALQEASNNAEGRSQVSVSLSQSTRC